MKHLKASLLITICLCAPNIGASSDDRSICHSSGIDPRLDAAWASIEASSNATNQALDRHRDNLAHLSDVCLAYRESTPQQFHIPLGVFNVQTVNGRRQINNNGELEVLEQVRIIRNFPFDFSRHLPKGVADSSFLFVMDVLLRGARVSPQGIELQSIEVRNIVGDPAIAAAINEQAEHVKESEQGLRDALADEEKAREYFRLLKPLIMALRMIPTNEQSVREMLMKDAYNELATIIKSMLNEGLLNPTVLTDELALLKAEESETGRTLKLAIDSGDDAKINTAGNTATKASIERAMFEYEFINLLASDRGEVFENEPASSDIDQLAKIAEHEKLSDFVTWSLNVLDSARSFGDEAFVSVARDHFLKAYAQKDTLEAAAYPGRLRIEIKDKDHECFIWGLRMQALRQQKKIANENYYNKDTEFNKKYPHNPVGNQSFTFMAEKEIEDLIESLKEEITLEMKADLTELLRIKQIRGAVTKDYSESYDKWQSIKNDLLKLTRRYMEAFPNALIRLTSQVVIDEENEREAKMYAEKEAAFAVAVAWDLLEQNRKADADAAAAVAQAEWYAYEQAAESNREEPSEASVDVGVEPVSLALSTNEYGLSAEQQEFMDSFYRLHTEWIAANQAIDEAKKSEEHHEISKLIEIQDHLGFVCGSKFDEYYFKYFDGKSLNQLFGSEEGLKECVNQRIQAYCEIREALNAAEEAGEQTKIEFAKKQIFVVDFLLRNIGRFRENFDNSFDRKQMQDEVNVAWGVYQQAKEKLKELEATGDESSIEAQKAKVEAESDAWWSACLRIENLIIAEAREPLRTSDDDVDKVSESSDSDESRSCAFEQNTVIELLADLKLSGERQTALNALYDLFRRQDQPENLGNHTVKNEFEIGKAEFYQQYFSSEEGQVRTAEKLIDLEQKIQYLKDAFNTTCQAFENSNTKVTTEEQALAIGRNGWSLSFLRSMYEAHHTALKDFLNSVATEAAAAAAESSDDEWAAGALVEDGVIAELNAISHANLDLTDDQQAALKELFDISMRAGALEHSLASATRARDVVEMTQLRARLAAAKRANQEARDRYTKEYIYSSAGMLRTPSKLQDLQQKIRFLKSLHERAERLLDKISSQADGVQAEAIACKFFSIGFLIDLYEQHYSMLKDFLEKKSANYARCFC